MKFDICIDSKVHHTLEFHLPHLYVGALWHPTLPPNSLVQNQVVWPCLVLHYEAQEVTINIIYKILLDIIQNMSHHIHMNQHP